MTQIVGFGKHPLVKGEPRELAIDKASLGMGIDRRDLDGLGAGAHYRSPDGAGGELVDADSIYRVAEYHCRCACAPGSKAHAIKHTWRMQVIRATVVSARRRGLR